MVTIFLVWPQQQQHENQNVWKKMHKVYKVWIYLEILK